jgi:hydrogenase nickel incorporation protein HypA/HybF
MHEMKLVENMVDILEKEVSDLAVGHVKKIYLEIGSLRAVVPELVIYAFENAPKNEKLKGAGIEIEIMPVKFRCVKCGAVKEAEESAFACKSCDSQESEMISGKEFIIKGIEW